jgi:hypothetical protein
MNLKRYQPKLTMTNKFGNPENNKIVESYWLKCHVWKKRCICQPVKKGKFGGGED